jgi:hypothetical protein
MKRIRIGHPSPSMAVAIAALVVATAGSAVANQDAITSALSKPDKKKVKKIADNRINLKAPDLTVKSAGTANTAATAANATNAENLGGTPKTGFGAGIVFGSMRATPPGAFFRSAFGPSSSCASDIACVAVRAPVALTLRDFRANPGANVDAGDQLQVQIEINGVNTALCTISTASCSAAGPITIPTNATLQLALNGVALEGDETWGFAYRLVPA